MRTPLKNAVAMTIVALGLVVLSGTSIGAKSGSGPQLISIANPQDPVELNTSEFNKQWFILLRRVQGGGAFGGSTTFWAYGPYDSNDAANTYWDGSSQRAATLGYSLIGYHQVDTDEGSGGGDKGGGGTGGGGTGGGTPGGKGSVGS